MEEVRSSILLSSTLRGLPTTDRATGCVLGGLVAGEGSFYVVRRRETFADGSPRLRFVFALSMAAWDRDLVQALRDFLGVGRIEEHAARQAHHQPTCRLLISSAKDHHSAVIPFSDAFIPPSQKRVQFEAWRDALLTYERERLTQYGRGRSTCSEPGCDRPVRGRGLCRSHYHRGTGY